MVLPQPAHADKTTSPTQHIVLRPWQAIFCQHLRERNVLTEVCVEVATDDLKGPQVREALLQEWFHPLTCTSTCPKKVTKPKNIPQQLGMNLLIRNDNTWHLSITCDVCKFAEEV